jgi:hypothetical protein
MSTSRSVALVVGGGLLAAWLAATAGSAGHRAPVGLADPGPDGVTPRSVPFALRASTFVAPTAEAWSGPAVRRDLFRFGRVERRQPDRVAAAAVVSALAAAAAIEFSPPPPRQPEWRLVGIAESGEGERRSRTAIISGAHDVYLVSDGARLAGEFEVTRIQSETIELRRLIDGSVLVLRLNPR